VIRSKSIDSIAKTLDASSRSCRTDNNILSKVFVQELENVIITGPDIDSVKLRVNGSLVEPLGQSVKSLIYLIKYTTLI
jgi:hypothetical protein